MYSAIIFGIIFASIVALAYYFGFRRGKNEAKETIVLKAQTVKTIAELATVQVTGVDEFQSNDFSENSWYSSIRNLLVGRNVILQVPYTAKFGVALSNKDFRQSYTNNKVTIHLPEPELLSYEAKIDQMNVRTQLGILLEENTSMITEMQKKLYEQSRNKHGKDIEMLNQTKAKVIQTFKNFYEPLGVQVEVHFHDDTIINLNSFLQKAIQKQTAISLN